jgi:SAM-dependent methyltransferase
VAFSYLHDRTGADIAEIGAGNSRLLATLARSNRCHAIDEYRGLGGGPKRRPTIDKVEFINCIIGNSKELIKDGAYDIVFSVSVVEHVPPDQLPGFFADCRRILKPDGLMVHLIDVYCEGVDGNNDVLWKRVQGYLQPFKDGTFSPAGEMEFSALRDVAFKTSFASNPDDMMRDWNRSSPTLVEKRKVAQSCSLEMVGRRPALDLRRGG